MKKRLSKIFGNKAFKITAIIIAIIILIPVGIVNVTTNLPAPKGDITNTVDNQPWKLAHLPAPDAMVSKLLPDGTYKFTTDFTVPLNNESGMKFINMSESGIISFREGQCAVKSRAKGEQLNGNTRYVWDILLSKAYDSNTFVKELVNKTDGASSSWGNDLNIWNDNDVFSVLDTGFLSIHSGLTLNFLSAYKATCSLAFLSRISKTSAEEKGLLNLDQDKIYEIGQDMSDAWALRRVDAVTNKFDFIHRRALIKLYAVDPPFLAIPVVKITNDNGVITVTSTWPQRERSMVLTTALTPTTPITITAPKIRDSFDQYKHEVYPSLR